MSNRTRIVTEPNRLVPGWWDWQLRVGARAWALGVEATRQDARRAAEAALAEFRRPRITSPTEPPEESPVPNASVVTVHVLPGCAHRPAALYRRPAEHQFEARLHYDCHQLGRWVVCARCGLTGRYATSGNLVWFEPSTCGFLAHPDHLACARQWNDAVAADAETRVAANT